MKRLKYKPTITIDNPVDECAIMDIKHRHKLSDDL